MASALSTVTAAASGGQRIPKRRGPISCAECRRLKIKCDRIVPCTPCQKRGCASLCPDGSLVSKGSRYILSDTESLHRKIEELTLRVRELEKGLEDERTQHSSEKHPLLEDHLISIAAPPTQEDHEAEAEDGPISTFGTLMIADDGAGMKWLGSTAVAAWFLKDEAEGVTEQPHYIDDPNDPSNPRSINSHTILPKNLFEICQNFPFGNIVPDERTRDLLYGYLPQEEGEATLLIERFFTNIGWLYNIVPKKRLMDMVKVLYDPTMPPHALGMTMGGMNGVDPNQNTQGAGALGSHRLAIIFTVFALNTLVDQHPRPEWYSTNTYSELARAALGMDTIFGTNATLATVQALTLLSLWYQLSDDSGDPSKSWGCLGLTFKVAQSIGLHRDGKNWPLGEEEAMDRRRVFWELQAIDTWQALGYGRPPSLVKPHFDCPQPFDTEESLGHAPHFHRWKHHYISEGIMGILEQALISNSSSATSPPYATILKLDSKIRSCAIPAKLQLKDPAARSQADEMLLLQHYTAHLSRESALMYLHRGFFARAVFDPPHDPLRNKFAHSVLAVYTSACQILKWFKDLVDNHAHLLSRIFGWWGHAFSSAVTLGGLVTMAPACNLAEQALREFDSAVEFLQRGTVGPQARRILPALEKLQTKAHHSYQLHLEGKWKPEMNRKAPPPPEMPGLGTAVLPLAKKSVNPSTGNAANAASVGSNGGASTGTNTQSPSSPQHVQYLRSRSSPPADSPPHAQSFGEQIIHQAQAQAQAQAQHQPQLYTYEELQPQPAQVPTGHAYGAPQGINVVHPHPHQDLNIWPLDMHNISHFTPDILSAGGTVSPQELMQPPVLSRQNTSDSVHGVQISNHRLSDANTHMNPQSYGSNHSNSSHSPISTSGTSNGMNSNPNVGSINTGNGNPGPPYVTLINAEFMMKGMESGRSFSQAQSFDDFLRLHKLQEQGIRRPSGSVFNMTAHATSQSQSHSQQSQPRPQPQPKSQSQPRPHANSHSRSHSRSHNNHSFDVGPSERNRDPWGEMQDVQSFEAAANPQSAAHTAPSIQPMHGPPQRSHPHSDLHSHFPSHGHPHHEVQYTAYNETPFMDGNIPGGGNDYFQDNEEMLDGSAMAAMAMAGNHDNIYNDLSWQVFMNGLGI